MKSWWWKKMRWERERWRECEAALINKRKENVKQARKKKSEPRETKAKSYHYFESHSTSRLPCFFKITSKVWYLLWWEMTVNNVSRVLAIFTGAYSRRANCCCTFRPTKRFDKRRIGGGWWALIVRDSVNKKEVENRPGPNEGIKKEPCFILIRMVVFGGWAHVGFAWLWPGPLWSRQRQTGRPSWSI